MSDLLKRLSGIRKAGEGWTARCPAHPDQHNSLSLDHREGNWLLKCHAGCTAQSISAAIGLTLADLFDDTGQRGGGGHLPIGAKIDPGRDIGCEVCAFAARWRGADEPGGLGRRCWPQRVGR